MPIYTYKHECGFEGKQFLKEDKDTIVLHCSRCGRGVSAKQVRDKAVEIKENNEVRGIFRHDKNTN